MSLIEDPAEWAPLEPSGLDEPGSEKRGRLDCVCAINGTGLDGRSCTASSSADSMTDERLRTSVKLEKISTMRRRESIGSSASSAGSTYAIAREEVRVDSSVGRISGEVGALDEGGLVDIRRTSGSV